MRVPGHQRKSYIWRWTAAVAALAVVGVAVVMAVVAAPAEDVQAAAFTVNDTADTADANLGDGVCDVDLGTAGSQCTLRAAIQEANFTGGVADTIGFSITGAGPHTITVGGTALPVIVDDNLTIDGGAEVIIVKPTVAVGNALLDIDSDGVTIQSLILDGDNYGLDGINIRTNNDEATIQSVQILDFNGNGLELVNNNEDNVVDDAYIHDNAADGILLGTGSDDNSITDSTIEDNGQDGIDLIDGSGNEVRGSTIDDNGAQGINATSQSALVIHSNSLSDNLINQILIQGAGTGVVTIKNNAIDVDSDGIELHSSCACDDVKINGDSCAEANQFSGPLGTDEYYLENMSGEGIDAEYNYWAGDTDPTDKICASDQTNGNCDGGGPPAANSDVDWDPVAAASCGGPTTATATPTNTPTITQTPTITNTPTITPTSTPTGATATPTTGPLESVTLVGGTCNPVASTYADNTSIDTIADAVSPSGILISIWWFDTSAVNWRGYSPQFPQVSDLSDVDRLEAIFICVASAGSWSRPEV